MRETKSITLQVVGLSFVDEYPANVTAIQEATPAELVRNPDNPFDGNAIEVRTADGQMIGHIPGDRAARMAAAMDRGSHELSAMLLPARINPNHPDRPGVSVSILSTRIEVTA